MLPCNIIYVFSKSIDVKKPTEDYLLTLLSLTYMAKGLSQLLKIKGSGEWGMKSQEIFPLSPSLPSLLSLVKSTTVRHLWHGRSKLSQRQRV